MRLHDAYRDEADGLWGWACSAGVALRRRYAKPALVMSSTLQRARETAQHVYAEVLEAPFLAGGSLQIQSSSTTSRAHAGRRVVSARRRRAQFGDWGQFLLFLGERRSRRALQQVSSARVGPPLESKLDDDGAAVVFVAGHGDYLQEVCGLDEKPANNAVLRRRIVISDGVLREEPGPCDLILRGAAEAAKNDINLDASDVARCVDRAVAPFLGIRQPSCPSHRPRRAFSFPTRTRRLQSNRPVRTCCSFCPPPSKSARARNARTYVAIFRPRLAVYEMRQREFSLMNFRKSNESRSESVESTLRRTRRGPPEASRSPLNQRPAPPLLHIKSQAVLSTELEERREGRRLDARARET